MRPTILSLTLIPLAACTTVDPLYCDENRMCTDPERPFCDLAGEYPASNGVARTCIPSPEDADTDDGADGEDDESDSGDGGGQEADAAPPTDAAPACAWTPLSRMANINSVDAEYPGSLDDDGLALLFQRAGSGPEDGFYVATRASLDEPFGQATQIEELGGDDVFRADPEFSSSRQEIFYRGSGSIDTATRSSPAATFGAAEPTGLSGTSPSLSGDDLALYFISKRGVERAVRTAIGGKWSSPALVLPLEEAVFYSVDVAPDELRLLLNSHPFNPAPFPVMIAERASTDEDFGAPIAVNDEILVPDASTYSASKWDASQTQMVVSLQLDGEQDLYYSVCQ